MRRIPNLYVKNGRFYFRRRIPKSLMPQLGESHLVKSLNGCSYDHARQFVLRLTLETDKVFTEAMTNPELTRIQINDLIRSIYHDIENELEIFYQECAKPPPFLHEMKTADELADLALQRAGIAIDRENDSWWELWSKLFDVYSEARSESYIHRRDAGLPYYNHHSKMSDISRLKLPWHLVDDAPEASHTPPQAQTIEGPKYKISEAAEKYCAEKAAQEDWRKDSEVAFNNSINLFIEWHGDKEIHTIQRSVFAECVEIIRKLPKHRNKAPQLSKPISQLLKLVDRDPSIVLIGEGTVSKHMGYIGALFKWAAQKGYINTDHATGVYKAPKRKRKQSEERNAWSIEQLKRWFSSTIYRGYKSEGNRKAPGDIIGGDHFFWVPIISLYHGMRLEECCQLELGDIREIDGIMCFDIKGGLTDEEVKATGKSVKNAQAIRKVPIHKILIELGFEDYLKQQKGQVFPKLIRQAEKSNYGKYLGRRFGEYVKFNNIEGVSFHSFRHTMITELNQSSLSLLVNEELVGHSHSGQTDRYYKGGKIVDLKKAIDSVEYEGINAEFIRTGGRKKEMPNMFKQ